MTNTDRKARPDLQSEAGSRKPPPVEGGDVPASEEDIGTEGAGTEPRDSAYVQEEAATSPGQRKDKRAAR